MSDFFENFSDEIEENAGGYAALGGLAALSGQQAQRQKLADIETQLKQTETRVEKEAHLKRKLVALEEMYEDYESYLKDKNTHWSIAAQHGFKPNYCQDDVGKASEQLSSIDDIKYARTIEKKANAIDSILNPCCTLYVQLKTQGVWGVFLKQFLPDLENKLQCEVLEFVMKSTDEDALSAEISKCSKCELLELFGKLANEKGLSIKPYLNDSNITQFITTAILGGAERELITIFRTPNNNKFSIKVSTESPCLIASTKFAHNLNKPNALNQGRVFRKEYQKFFDASAFKSYEELALALSTSVYFGFLSGKASEHQVEKHLNDRERKRLDDKATLAVNISVISIVIFILLTLLLGISL